MPFFWELFSRDPLASTTYDITFGISHCIPLWWGTHIKNHSKSSDLRGMTLCSCLVDQFTSRLQCKKRCKIDILPGVISPTRRMAPEQFSWLDSLCPLNPSWFLNCYFPFLSLAVISFCCFFQLSLTTISCTAVFPCYLLLPSLAALLYVDVSTVVSPTFSCCCLSLPCFVSPSSLSSLDTLPLTIYCHPLPHHCLVLPSLTVLFNAIDCSLLLLALLSPRCLLLSSLTPLSCCPSCATVSPCHLFLSSTTVLNCHLLLAAVSPCQSSLLSPMLPSPPIVTCWCLLPQFTIAISLCQHL